MAINIANSIETINKSLEWIKKHKPEQYEKQFLQLVEERLKLKKIYEAEKNNPGIAAYGQSQVGKSYLMNCILQNSNSPFMVETENGEYNFVEKINPIGEGQEATGVVTRFSSYELNESEYIKQYPIRMRVHSVKDVVAIISDTYFNEFDDYTTVGDEDIKKCCEEWVNKYSKNKPLPKPFVSPDDMLDLKAYFKKHINNAQTFTNEKTALFEKLALLIDKIPPGDYAEIFSIFWNKEEAYTRIFNRCHDTIKRLDYSDYIYLPIEAVLHGGTKQDTIMSVSCLKLLSTQYEDQYKTSAYKMDRGEIRNLGIFSKSELCVVCSEVIIKISSDFLVKESKYDTQNMQQSSKDILSDQPMRLEILKHTDLLDFPGARARGGMLLNKIKEHEQLMYSLLRGKVSYLFNKYNSEKSINILLYCHHHKNNEVPTMWQMLESWVEEYVGDTPEKRAELIRQTTVSPLFHIGTMFNLNLQYPDNREDGMTDKGITSKWKGRFQELLLEQIFRKTNENWVANWTGRGIPFQNCYMLRDYEFSKNIYDGWEEYGKEKDLKIDMDYYKRNRDLFIKSNREYNLFKDAALAWDVSATQNNDGALYIMENLVKVATNIREARKNQFNELCKKSLERIYSIMKDYYVIDDAAEILAANIKKANAIFRELEFTCQANPEYFGHLLQAMQISEIYCYNEVHKIVPKLTDMLTQDETIRDYELIRVRCDNFRGCVSEEEHWERLISAYRFGDKDEAVNYLVRRKVEPDKLFSNSNVARKPSAIIANELVNQWKERLAGVEFTGEFSGDGRMDDIVLNNLIDCMIGAATNIKLADRIEDEISDYVNIQNFSLINEDMVADIVSTTISDFVMDFGFRYLTKEQRDNSFRIAKQQNLDCYKTTQQPRKEKYSSDEMTGLFDTILSSGRRFTPAYEANYNSWLEYMYISYIVHLNVPDYDHEANEDLKVILDELIANV